MKPSTRQKESIAERIGPFRIVSPIARGGMGRVYLAEHEKDGRRVAVKVLPEEFLADKKRSQYLEREMKIAKNLSHPNVVKIFGLHRRQGVGYLIMEYLDGGNLRRHIRDQDLGLAGTLGIILKICEGLHYIHNHKLEDGRFHSIIHRDIKPENILLSRNGRLKVADFGLSLSEDSWALRKPKSRAGTPLYMSPEHIRGKALDVRTDIYSLGLVMYELLTGQLPYKVQDREMYMKMVISKKVRPSPPSYLDSKISRQLDEITMKAIGREADGRYQTVTELMLDLRRMSPMTTPDDIAEEFLFMREVKVGGTVKRSGGIAQKPAKPEPLGDAASAAPTARGGDDGSGNANEPRDHDGIEESRAHRNREKKADGLADLDVDEIEKFPFIGRKAE